MVGPLIKSRIFVKNDAYEKNFPVDNLLKMHRLLVVNWCCICKSDVETVGYLLIHCKGAYEF